ncbi:hypothetical protein [Pseudanabaena sp. PCC 6802]|uniref:hypothetical protein n=1 Tax=Pseudanabaena sp. PCC 6802 TaxID=118173 RepID=UPI0003483CA3|nr:hypothetical protein [Pseudanabaena sp. PCC 6802]
MFNFLFDLKELPLIKDLLSKLESKYGWWLAIGLISFFLGYSIGSKSNEITIKDGQVTIGSQPLNKVIQKMEKDSENESSGDSQSNIVSLYANLSVLGIFKVEPVLKTLDADLSGKSNDKLNSKHEEQIVKLTKGSISDILNKYNLYHIHDSKIIEGLSKLNSDDKIVIELVDRMNSGLEPFNYQQILVGFADETSLVKGQAAACTGSVYINKNIDLSTQVNYPRLVSVSVNNPWPCPHDPCNQESPKPISNKYYIQISFSDAKYLFPERYKLNNLGKCESAYARFSGRLLTSKNN